MAHDRIIQPKSRSSRNWSIDRLLSRVRFGDRVFSNITLVFALLVVATLVGMIVILNIDAMPSIRKFGGSFLGSTAWNAVSGNFGALPAMFGTLLTSFIALVIAVPISIGAAVFLAELAPPWIRGPASFLVEMLAAIPSVIIGLWGLIVMVPYLAVPEKWLARNVGFVPFFRGPVFGGVSFLAAGIILAIMIVPIIAAVSRDAIRSVPQSQKEAMLALGATRWETIRKAVIPYCRSGLIGGTILGLGRAMGETMAVTMVIGNKYWITPSLVSPGTTVASKIAAEFAEADTALLLSSLVELALVLFGVTLVVNVIARVLVWRLTAVKAEGAG